MNIKQKAYKLIKSCDFYGVDIGLNYRQHKSYKTFYGGLWSSIIASLIAALCISQFLDCIFYLSPEIHHYTKDNGFNYKLLESSTFRSILLDLENEGILNTQHLNNDETLIDIHSFKSIAISIPTIHEDINDVDNPIKFGKLQKIVREVVQNHQLTIHIQLKILEYQTDSGLLWEILNTHDQLYLEDVDTYYLQSDKTSLRLIFTINPIIKHVDRSYKRIYRILSITGGLVKVLMFVGKFFSKPITTLKFQVSFLNQFFNFGSTKDSKSFYPLNSLAYSQKLLRMQTVRLDSIKVNPNTKELTKQPTKMIKSILKKYSQQQKQNADSEQQGDEAIIEEQNQDVDELIAKYFQPQDIRLKLQHIQYVKYFFGFTGQLKKRIKQLRQNLQIVNQKTDIIYVFNKLQELEKLKQLLLDEDQLNLFEYIPKPNIDVSHNRQEPKNNTIVKATQAFNSFQAINEKEKKSRIDNALIKMIDANIKKYFVVSSGCISFARNTTPKVSYASPNSSPRKRNSDLSENLKHEEVNEY
ncbi:unnamed protein product (macronuclear) [Paramecium tetraurelia]|uniref:Transmembrane protein n=1 Tax=Paramecium tetraurelia TaxID=5888 RepID=A0CU53_PARTE|nr:uncharacterized protein GSPATT00010519001 [Paramecium tetraurelia]CAK74320.1 unnamed protein product [Paramecium tetraurelia]|eukprot:XP_001441717.1 hypothetical protein (macronuclear) [Paramecium tetraurelia strain d4-2]